MRLSTARGSGSSGPRDTRSTAARTAADRRAAIARGAQPARRPAQARVADGARVADVAGVRITHPDRVVYADEELTKLDVARYYERIAEWMLPHLRGRALTLVRCPEGAGTACFYMKHSKVWAPAGIRRVKIQEKTKVGDYLVADTAEALVGLIQMGVLEIHTWNSRVEDVERPDRLVLDLDPGEHVTWPQVIDGARLIRRLLERAGLDSFVKTTGGRGLHVVVPLKPSAGWPACLEFSRAVATAIEQAEPDRYTTAFAKAGRERKILVDYLRNNRTNTSVAAFSTRARRGAPVSVPLRWTELKPALDPSSFTVLTVEKRLSRLRGTPGTGTAAAPSGCPAPPACRHSASGSGRIRYINECYGGSTRQAGGSRPQ